MALDTAGRYARQIAVPGIGVDGQQLIGAARVLVVGAGGLGCALLPHLCAAGVGQLILVDPDHIEESNLHRQPLYQTSDIGQPKVIVAKAALAKLHPFPNIDARVERLTPANAASLVARARHRCRCCRQFRGDVCAQ